VLRSSDETDGTPLDVGVVVVDVRATLVFAGTVAAAGSVNEPLTPTEAGTAIDCAVLAAIGAVVETLAGASVATAVGAGTGVDVGAGKTPAGPFDPAPQAASVPTTTRDMNEIASGRTAVNENVFNA
jgi:hypothetical protein